MSLSGIRSDGTTDELFRLYFGCVDHSTTSTCTKDCNMQTNNLHLFVLGALCSISSLASAQDEPGSTPPPTPDSDFENIVCADSTGVRYSYTVVTDAIEFHCDKDNEAQHWNKDIVPPISIGDGETANGMERAWKASSSFNVPDSMDNFWAATLFKQEECQGHSNFVVGPSDIQKLERCRDPYYKILDKCSDEDYGLVGGYFEDGCIVYDLRIAPEGEMPYADWYPKKGPFTCEQTDDFGDEDSPSADTCTCWFEGMETLTDVFHMPDSGDCADVGENDLYFE